MLRIEEGRNDHIQAHRLTLLGRAGYKKMRSGRKVEGLDLSGDSVTYRNRKLILGISERIIIQGLLQRHDRRLPVSHFDTDAIRKHNNTYSLGSQRHTYFSMEILDSRNLYSRSRNNLIKGNSRTDNCSHLHDLNLVVHQSRADPVIIDLKLLLRYGMLTVCIIVKKIYRREFIPLEFRPVVNPLKLFCHNSFRIIVPDDLYSFFSRLFLAGNHFDCKLIHRISIRRLAIRNHRCNITFI